MKCEFTVLQRNRDHPLTFAVRFDAAEPFNQFVIRNECNGLFVAADKAENDGFLLAPIFDVSRIDPKPILSLLRSAGIEHVNPNFIVRCVHRRSDPTHAIDLLISADFRYKSVGYRVRHRASDYKPRPQMPIETFRPDASLMVSDLDMKNQILLEDEFWDIVGGKGTFTELLEIYREVGEEKGRQIIKRLGYGL